MSPQLLVFDLLQLFDIELDSIYVRNPQLSEIFEEWKTILMSLAILFHFLCDQHVSDINIYIIRSLRLFCWITTLIVLFLVRCVLEIRCGWVGVVSVLQVEASACTASTCNTDTTPTQPHRNSNTHRTKNNATNVVIQQNSRKLLMMDIWMSKTCWAHKKWNKIASDLKLVFYSSTIINKQKKSYQVLKKCLHKTLWCAPTVK